MPELIDDGHLYLAVPPLYRLSHGGKTVYARDDAHKDELLAHRVQGQEARDRPLQGPGRDDAGAAQGNHHGPEEAHAAAGARSPTDDRAETADAVERLMGNKPEARFTFIQERAAFATDLVDI